MNKEMAELRKILALFEDAGFTPTYFRARYSAHSFEIAIKSKSIIEDESDVGNFQSEPADTITVANLFKKTGYEIAKYVKKWEIAAGYAGTIFLEIVPEGSTLR
jgi:hypothetical protein